MDKPHRRWSPATPDQQELAATGLKWLEDCKLEVVLVPAPDPKHVDHKIRMVNNQNPCWYQRMAGRRGFDKRGKKKRYGSLRVYVVRALKRVVSGWVDPIGVELEALEEIERDLREGYR